MTRAQIGGKGLSKHLGENIWLRKGPKSKRKKGTLAFLPIPKFVICYDRCIKKHNYDKIEKWDIVTIRTQVSKDGVRCVSQYVYSG